MKPLACLAALAGLLAWLLARLLAQIQHTIINNWSNGATTISASTTLTGQLEVNVAEVVPASTTNRAVANYAFTLAKLQSFYALSDQAVTLKTNSSGSPQETIALAANVPLSWVTGSGDTALFAGDVTALYLTTGSIPASANVNIKTLVVSP